MVSTKLSAVHDSGFINRLADTAAKDTWGIVACKADRTIVWANATAHDLLLQVGETLIGQSFDTNPHLPLADCRGLQKIARPDGSNFWIFATNRPFEDVTLISFSDASEVAHHISSLSYEESIWRNAIQSAGHGVWDYNASNVAQFQSDEWKRMRGFPTDRPIADTYDKWEARLHPEDVPSVREHVRRHNAGEVDTFAFEYRERLPDGNYVWILATGKVVEKNAKGIPTRIVGTDINISQLKADEQKRRYDSQMVHDAHVAELEKAQQCTEAARQIAHVLSRQDPLTQLDNRRVFSEEIATLTMTDDKSLAFAVLVVDLDRFKPVNDLYGHTVGDLILKTAAERLVQAAGRNSLVARLGGDEFGIILRPSDVPVRDAATDCARSLIGALSEPVRIGSFEVEIGASVGIALYPDHGRHHHSLFQHADMALYDIKQSLKGRFQLYSAEIGQVAEDKASLETAVRQAIAGNHIIPYFQPIIDLKTRKVSALEILSRWTSDTFGNVSPDRFIPIIDHFNMMPRLTTSILEKACIAARDWPDDVALSINLSAKEVCDLSTPVRLLKVLRKCAMPPTRLKVEVTEQALMHDMGTAKEVIGAMRKCGIKVMLDDFGAGYAGLGYLRELHFDSIKIDRSFVMSALKQKESAQIVTAIQTLAKHLDLETVAEGIEDEPTSRFLTRIGCHFGQGYHFSRPLPAGEVAHVLHGLNAPEAKSA